MKKGAFYNNRQSLVFYSALFVLFALLVYLFPYSGDDWAWGSQIGAERLQNWFDGYNGRYAGNLLVMALTRSKLLSVLTVSLSLVGACALPRIFASGSALVPCTLGALLLLTLPKGVFTQAVVWTSGFSNYVPPVLLTMLYFISVSNIFEKKLPQYKAYTGVICAVLGFAGALFIENITLFNIAISVVIIADCFRRHRKFFAPHLLYFAGSAAGAVLMFSNSAYGLIASQEDFYRSFCIERGIIDTLTENFTHFFDNLLADNFVSTLIFSLICTLLCMLIKKEGEKRRYAVCLRALSVNLTALVMLLAESRLDDRELIFESRGYAVFTTAVLFLVAVLYMTSAGVILYYGIKNDSLKNKALFIYVCIPLSAAPLMVVNPVGPRCFFPHCFMLLTVCITAVVYIMETVRPEAETVKKAGVILASACAVAFSFLFGIYAVIHSCDVKRNDLAKKQAEAGFGTVVTFYLPFSGYVWNGDPDCVPWNGDYKQFHGIDEDVKFKFILRESFSDFAKNFEQRQ